MVFPGEPPGEAEKKPLYIVMKEERETAERSYAAVALDSELRCTNGSLTTGP